MTTADTAPDNRVFIKIAWRLMPLLIAGYILNYLDRNNVGFAALTMNRELGLTATQFGRAAGIFFLGYCFFEVPSNIALYRVGPRIWLARIMITWGLISAATIFVTGPTSLYVLRFLLGVAEAGFFPGVAFYLGTWFPSEYRTRMIAWFMVAVPISSVVAGPVSGYLLKMDGLAGLAGWKWLFLFEGLPVVLVGFGMLRLLADRPEGADWLTETERQVVADRIRGERREKEVRHLLPALKDVRVLILAGIQFGFLVGSYGVGLFLPQIIKLGNLSDVQVGFVSSGCYVVAAAGMIVWASHVDRHGGKIANLALACLVSTVGFVGAIASANFWMSLAGVTVALTGINAARDLLDDSAALSHGHGRGRRPRVHQLHRHDGRVRRTVPDGMADRSHRLVHGGTWRHGRLPAAGDGTVMVAEMVRHPGLVASVPYNRAVLTKLCL